MDAAQDINRCRNCDAVAAYCPECGQSTKVALPTVFHFIQEALGALFSYDHKLWRTLLTLVAQPGKLTAEYIQGKRICYLTPFQLFFWLQTIAFVAYRYFFDSRAGAGNQISEVLLQIGICITFGLAAIHTLRRLPFLLHLITALHIWSFLMVLLMAEYTVTPIVANLLHRTHLVTGVMYIGTFVTHSSEVVMALYMTAALRKVYGGSWWHAGLKTALLCVVYAPFLYFDLSFSAIYTYLKHHF
jgi:Protein of unknown function (DUF3667)